MFDKFFKEKAPKVDESTLSSEELKQIRHERVRRNLRILALFVAGYYFVSAGFSWYEESQREELAAQNAQLVQNEDPLSDGPTFRALYNQNLNTYDTALPTANANDSVEGFVAVLSPSIELRGFCNPGERKLYAAQVQSRFTQGLEKEGLNAISAFILTLEKDLNLTAEILKNLGLIESEVLLKADHPFEKTQVQSPKYTYELNYLEGEIDELTLIAPSR